MFVKNIQIYIYILVYSGQLFRHLIILLQINQIVVIAILIIYRNKQHVLKNKFLEINIIIFSVDITLYLNMYRKISYYK